MSSAGETLRVERDGAVASVVLARPEVHEAFDERMIEELQAAFEELAGEASVRVVVLRSSGKSFCAGADLNWMKRMGEQSREENERDALRLAELFETIASCPKPVVARVQGAALGGGAGLVTAADLAVASEDARFGFTEVRLGILPAVIAPFVLRKLAPGVAQGLFLTGERFDAARALELGLVHRVTTPARLDEGFESIVNDLLAGSPEAQASVKKLVGELRGAEPEAARLATARAIALARSSRDGREGLTAFLGKRKPAWHPRAKEPS